MRESTANQFAVFSLFRLLAMTKLDACETQKGVSVSTGAKNPPGLDSKSGVVYETIKKQCRNNFYNSVINHLDGNHDDS